MRSRSSFRLSSSFSNPSIAFRVPLGWVEGFYFDTNAASARRKNKKGWTDMSPGRTLTGKTCQGFSLCKTKVCLEDLMLQENDISFQNLRDKVCNLNC